MSKYDKAGLVQIPSGYKAGTLYSVVPTNSNGDFDFSRASTATRVNKDGLIETVGSNVPRLNYPMIDGVVSGCPSLLLEPQRINFIPYSESFLGSSGAAYLTDSDEVSPDGSINGFKISEVSTNSYQSRFYTNISYVSGYFYTIYVFAKASTNDRFVLFGQTTSQPIVGYDLTNGTILTESNVTSSFIDNYGNGWYRCGFTFTSTSTEISQYGLNLIKNGTTNTYSYNGDTNKNILFYGASLEQGLYPTSYIPTSGSTVTRSPETCTGAGTSDTFNDSEGVLMAEISALDLSDTSSRRLGVTKNGTYEGLRLQLGNGNISATVYDGTTNQYSKSVNIDNSIFHKVALKYKTNDFALWIDGIEYHPQSSGSTFVNGTLDDISFDYVVGNVFYSNTKQLITFNTALTDSELEQLTSWTSFNEMAQGQLYTIE